MEPPIHRRRWRWYTPHDEIPVTRKEFAALPSHGQGALVIAMQQYSRGEYRSGLIKNVGGKLLELRAQVGNDHFRILFFHANHIHSIILRVFYKDTNKLPVHDRRLAEKRMRAWLEYHKKNSRYQN